MNEFQKRILVKLFVLSIFLLSIYVMFAMYIYRNYNDLEFIELIFFVSFFYLIVMGLIWIRERNLYDDYVTQKRIRTGHSEYIMCPNCRVIQHKGGTKCLNCDVEWFFCGDCQVPFEEGSSVLIAPCCGVGFHPDHFEAALREGSKCPSCGSTQALVEAEW